MEAIPVGAKTATLFLEVFLNNCKRVDFPVPALPVTKAASDEFSNWSRISVNSLLNDKGDLPCKMKIYKTNL